MKGNNITNNDLEQLFSAITAQSPLISEEQVHSLLINLPEVKPKSSVKQFLSRHLNILLIGVSSVLIIVTTTLFWKNSATTNIEEVPVNNPPVNATLPVSSDTIDTVKTVQATIDSSVTIDKEKPNLKDITVDAVSIADIQKYHQKKPQVFTIQSNRDTTLICKEGTSLEIKANSFIAEKTGNEIDGKIRITVQEYYTPSDIVLAGLSTTSGDNLLETGGMLYVEATAGKKKCSIKPGYDIQVGFPYSDKKEGMELFFGKQTGNRVDWQAANNPEPENHRVEIDVAAALEQETETYFIVEEMPEFPGGRNALEKYIAQNAIVPYSALKNNVVGKVSVNFIVDDSGTVKNIRVTRGLDKTLDKVAVYLVSKMPKWKPGKQRGNPVNVSTTVSVAFNPKQGELTDEEIQQAKDMDEKVKELKYDIESGAFFRNTDEFKELEENVKKGKLDEISTSDVNRYVFSATQLGWLNCDRFYGGNISLIDFSIPVDNGEEVTATVIFDRFKAIVRGRNEQDKIVYRNMPIGEKITIVALKTDGNKMYLAVQKTLVANQSELVLDYKKVTMKLLKKKMEELYQSGF